MSSTSKPKGSRSRSKKHSKVQTKKGGILQPSKSRKSQKKSKPDDQRSAKLSATEKSTLKTPSKKRQRSTSNNHRKGGKSANTKIIDSKSIVQCELCRHDAYQQNRIPFVNGTMKEFKRHLKRVHSKGMARKSDFTIIGEIDDIGNRHYFIYKSGGLKKCKYLYYSSIDMFMYSQNAFVLFLYTLHV